MGSVIKKLTPWDPLGLFDKPKAAHVAPIPTPLNDAPAYLARDRIRRMASKAQGRDSTIRTSATAAPYTGTPKTLLGS